MLAWPPPAAPRATDVTRASAVQAQAKALRAQRRAGFSAAAFASDFADEVADLVGAATAAGGGDGVTGEGLG